MKGNIWLLFILFLIGFYYLLPINAAAQKTTVEYGPFEPYGGRREVTYNKDSVPVELKEYDIVGNLRRHIIVSGDTQNRLTRKEESIYDEEKHLIGGFKKIISYKDSLDYGGKTIYKQFDPQANTFITIKPLISGYRQAMITSPPDSLQLDTFYKKYTDAFGIPIVSSGKAPDAALLVARDIVNYMLMKRPAIRAELVKRKSRVLVMAETEMETDLPERRDWKKPQRNDTRLTPAERENYDKVNGIGSMSDKQYWNQRARGMGGNVVSCAEENLLGYAGTKYYGENILVHEFSHNIMSALATVDTALYVEIEQAYEAAKSKGMYKNQYAINTVAEYWAEGTQWWFWSNDAFDDGQVHIQSPDDLKMYDPALYHILEQIYYGHHITADVYYQLNIHSTR
ncbi:hypothetical protein [Ilyomonas limi]|nr:hypothetical protein [Ilyomonas limi]